MLSRERRLGRRRRQHVAAVERFGAEVQVLEQRALLSGTPAAQFAVVNLVRYDGGTVGLQPNSSQQPTGTTPAQVRHAYGFDQISFNGTAGNGAGTTIAIVDSYDDPNIANDLHQFDLAWGLADPPSFTKVNESGSTSNLPAPNSGWITEIALDVEWAHAIAPGAKILLVEANSSSSNDLYAAVNTARNYAGVNVVSMSWGGGEYSSETSVDSYFTTPGGHAGVTFVASSGDKGAPTSYPSVSPNVVSVGGTTLTLDASGNWKNETAWGGSGGGISGVEAQPSYQKGVVTQSTTFRTNPDVAYDSSPSTGFGVYDSYNNGTINPWAQWGGTSDAAPQWAGLIAIADQGRAIAGKNSLDGATQTLPMLYGMSTSDFHDITTGASAGFPQYSAGPGYDLVTGRGTPFANLVVNDLIGQPANAPPTLTAISTLGIASPQAPFAISYATLLGASNAQDANNSPIQFRINGVQNGSLTISHNGVTTAVVPGTTLFGTGDTLTWTGSASISGSAVNAFTVTAFDGALSSSTAVQVTINQPTNVPPTLTTISTLGIASPQTAFSIGYATLLAASNAQDANSNPIQFRINGVQNGSLSITHNGITTAVVPGTTLFDAGDTLTWTSVAGVSGSVVNAFTVTAFDGTLSSLSPVQVNVSVQAVQPAFDLSGPWVIYSSAGVSQGLGQISQSGSNLTVVNSNGVSSAGQFTAVNQVLAASFDNTPIVTGTIDTIAADHGRILWADGTVWLRVSLGGEYSLSGPGISSPTLVSVAQSGTLLILVNGASTNSATISSTSQLTVSIGGGNTALATYADGKISFSSNGQLWTKLDLPTNYTNAHGVATRLIQNGTSLTFVDSMGHMSPGYWISPTQLFATAWNEPVTVALGKLLWQDGSIWNENLVLNGTKNGSGTTTITAAVTAAPSPVTVTDYVNGAGKPVHLVQTGTTNVIFIDSTGHMALGTLISPTRATTPYYPGDVAAFTANSVVWSDGTVWTQTAATSAITLTHYTNAAGKPVHLIQNGTNRLAFVDSIGQTSLGTMLSPTTALSNLYPGDVATISANTVAWQDGSLWTRANAGTLTITLTDTNGAASHVQFQSSTTLIGLDGSLHGLTATRQNGQIVWSNGAVWGGFDFNALNALFEMATASA